MAQHKSAKQEGSIQNRANRPG